MADNKDKTYFIKVFLFNDEVESCYFYKNIKIHDYFAISNASKARLLNLYRHSEHYRSFTEPYTTLTILNDACKYFN